jgi:hypothetical protein
MSVKGLKAFTATMQSFPGATIKQHNDYCKKIANELVDGIVLNTPVETGLARGNWQQTIGSPASSTVADIDKSGSSTVSKCKSVIMSSNPISDVLWLSNRLDYIEPLEDGHSGQAPVGMVEVTLQTIKILGV